VVFAWNIDGSEVRDGDSDPATNGPFHVRPGAQWEWTRSGPTLFDLDGDGAKEVIFGTKDDATGTTRIMAVKFNGNDAPGFPVVTNAGIGCDPAIGDLDNDGQVEIVVFSEEEDLGDESYVYAVRQDGSNYPGFPVNLGYHNVKEWPTSPALGDIDGDGMLEIVYAPNETGARSRIVVVDTDYSGGTSGQVKPGWPVILPGSSEGGPIIGDIDGDSSPEILHGNGGGDLSSPDNLYAFHADGSPMAGFPITLNGPLAPSVVITDLDRDLDVDIVYGGWDFQIYVWDLPFAYDRADVPWPTFGGNEKRDGLGLLLAVTAVDDPEDIPAANFTVGAGYPNPFNPSITVRLYIPKGSDLDLAVYDVQGRKVRSLHTGAISSGWHSMVWDGKDDTGRGQSSGMYFMRAVNEGEVAVQKMTLVK